MPTNPPNHLTQETSPYLQQHAHNPVNWYPWGKAALERARVENKPILVSIGYAACHWCHVMAHESFEDPATAELMNQLFINIKVDREERPDLDKIYQRAHFLLTQQGGGWPLTVFLSPQDLTPFFSGTYFPLEPRFHLPAFKQVLRAIADIYQHRPEELKQQNASLLALLQRPSAGLVPVELNLEPLKRAQMILQDNYDEENGGFKGAPKFPQPPRLQFLLGEHSPLTAKTLGHLAAGGIYDQIGGGFFRYSVDARWEIPHFEKMLYDNGQLLLLYALADAEHPDPVFARVAAETAAWIMRDIQTPEGGYISSIDADSEGQEGKYYVWNPTEIKALLTPAEYTLIQKQYGLDRAANFENLWHLRLQSASSELSVLAAAKEKLLKAREQRISPARDNKILTAWNALTIKGMLVAGAQFKQPAWVDSAQRALHCIQQKLWKNKRLLASYNEGKAHLSAYLDDHVFLMDALLTAVQFQWNTKQFNVVIELAEILLAYFADETAGGFYFTAKDQEQVLYRPKIFMDEVTPAGNAVAVSVLLTLGHLLGETRYITAAEKTLQAAWPSLTQFPTEHCSLLTGLKAFLEPPLIIVLRGTEPELKTWYSLCREADNLVFAIPGNEQGLPEALSVKALKGEICAYVCKGSHCLQVIEDVATLKLVNQNNKNQRE